MSSRLAIRDYLSSGVFNGTSSYIQSGTNTGITGTGAWTMTAWVNPTAFATRNVATFVGTGAVGGGFSLGLRGGKPDVGCNGVGAYTGSSPVVLNGWTQLVGTFDGLNVNVYANGVSVASGTGTPSVVNAKFFIGVYGDVISYPYFGRIADPSLWSRALSPAEVLALYANGVVPSNGLIRRYKLSDGNGTTPVDSSATGDTSTSTALTWSLDSPMKARPATRSFPYSLTFDGTSQGATVAMPALLQASTKTLELWVKPSGVAAVIQVLFGTNGTSGNYYVGLAAGNGIITSYANTALAQKADTSPITVQPGVWSHIAVTWAVSGSNVVVTHYLNGTPTLTTTRVDGISGTYGATLSLGVFSSSNRFHGSIADIAFYASALSAADVRLRSLNLPASVAPTEEWLPSAGTGTTLAGSAGDSLTLTSASQWSLDAPSKGRGPQNLAPYSGDLSQAAWNKVRSSVATSADVPAGHGFTQSWQIEEDATAGATHELRAGNIQPVSGVVTASGWFKASASNYIMLAGNGGGVTMVASLSNCTVFSKSALALTATTTTAGNGWCFATLTYASTSATYFSIYLTNDGSTVVFNGTNGQTDTLAVGLQLVPGAAPGPYVATGANPVNPGGLAIPPTQQNLLKYSEDFTQSGTWIQQNLASVAANQIANPRNGAVNVSGLIGTNASTTHYIDQGVSYTLGLTYTFSVYAKAGNQNWLLMEGIGGSAFCYFNITAGSGAVGSVGVGVTGHIQALPNGWYLCSITYVPTSASTNALLLSASANGSPTFVGGGTTVDTYLFGAMITQTSGLTAYTPTTNAIVSGGSMRQLVPQAQNLILYGQDLTNTTWLKDSGAGGSAPVVTGNYSTAPDGTLTATRVQLAITGTTGSYSRVGQTITTVASTYTFSVWMKSNTGLSVTVDLRTIGVDTNVTVTASWQRLSVTLAVPVGTTNYQILLFQTTGTSTSADLSVWGAQVVQSNYPGPYQLTTAIAVNNGPIRRVAI